MIQTVAVLSTINAADYRRVGLTFAEAEPLLRSCVRKLRDCAEIQQVVVVTTAPPVVGLADRYGVLPAKLSISPNNCRSPYSAALRRLEAHRVDWHPDILLAVDWRSPKAAATDYLAVIQKVTDGHGRSSISVVDEWDTADGLMLADDISYRSAMIADACGVEDYLQYRSLHNGRIALCPIPRSRCCHISDRLSYRKWRDELARSRELLQPAEAD